MARKKTKLEAAIESTLEGDGNYYRKLPTIPVVDSDATLEPRKEKLPPKSPEYYYGPAGDDKKK